MWGGLWQLHCYALEALHIGRVWSSLTMRAEVSALLRRRAGTWRDGDEQQRHGCCAAAH